MRGDRQHSGLPTMTWSEVAATAGSPPARRPILDENPRLFGAARPEVVFWRDNSLWCPYCLRVWLLLEAMRLPYVMKTIPLRAYLRPGEVKPREYTTMVPSGVVPALQFRTTTSADAEDTQEDEFGPAIEGVARLVGLLEQRYPSAFPGRPDHDAVAATCYDAVVRPGGVRDAFELARRAYETCAGAPVVARGVSSAHEYFHVTGLVDACRSLDAVLQVSGGPFVCGAAPTAADYELLPLLERASCVPLYFWGPDALGSGEEEEEEEDPVALFAGLRRLLAAATASTPFAHLASDATTLCRTNLRYAPPGFAPKDTAYAERVDRDPAWLRAATPAACRDAAARLARNAEGIAKFAAREAHRLAPSSGDDDVAASSPARLASIDLALRVVAATLVTKAETSDDDAAAIAARDGAALSTAEMHPDDLRAAADALDALSLNIGVPRDMDEPAANALRAYTRLVAETLREPSRRGPASRGDAAA